METKDNSEKEGFTKFTKEELAEFKKFWQSPTGEKYMKKMKDTKEQLLDAAMGAMDTDYVVRTTAIANGFHSVIVDVESIIKAIDAGKKKEAEAEKK